MNYGVGADNSLRVTECLIYKMSWMIAASKTVLFLNVYFYFCLHWFLIGALGLPLVAASEGCSLDAVHGRLIVLAPLIAEHGLLYTWASVAAANRLRSLGALVVVRGLSCPAACGIFPGQGTNQCRVFCTARRILNHWTTRDALKDSSEDKRRKTPHQDLANGRKLVDVNYPPSPVSVLWESFPFTLGSHRQDSLVAERRLGAR